jgi:hypothetical protein
LPNKPAHFPGGPAEGGITDSLREIDTLVGVGTTRPRDTRGGAWQEEERLSLLEKLRSLPTHQFNAVHFVLDPPEGAVPPMPARPEERVNALLSWAERDEEGGLEKLRRVLERIDSFLARGRGAAYGEPQLPQPIAPERVREIKRLLGRLGVTERVVRRCFHLSLMSPRQLPDELRDRPLDTLMYCLDTLAQMACNPPSSAPLLEFLERLLPHLSASAVRDDVARYVSEIGAELGVEVELIRRKVAEQDAALKAKAAREPYLLVNVQEIGPEQFHVVGWVLYGDEFEKMGERECAMRELPAFIEKLIENCQSFLEQLVGDDEDVLGGLVIEVFLPIAQLDCEPTCWKVSAGVDPYQSRLGIMYRVVVRSWERTYDRRFRSVKGRWRAKWQSRPRPLTERREPHVCWAFSDDDLEEEKLFHKLMASAPIFVTVAPICRGGKHDTVKVFRSLVTSGTPIALWPRRSPADATSAREDVRELIYERALDALPQEVYKRRREAAAAEGGEGLIWNSMTLMWDDPDRRPPDFNKRLAAP